MSQSKVQNALLDHVPDQELAQRARLASTVATELFKGTESFEHDGVGSQIAYLLWAIIDGDHLDLFNTSKHDDVFFALLTAVFPLGHPVFSYILRHTEEVGDVTK